jgi:hypothetical protein
MKAVKKWTLKFELEGAVEDEDDPVPYIVVARLTLVSVSFIRIVHS